MLARQGPVPLPLLIHQDASECNDMGQGVSPLEIVGPSCTLLHAGYSDPNVCPHSKKLNIAEKCTFCAGFPGFSAAGPGCCFVLQLSIPGRDQAAWDRCNHDRLQSASLTVSQKGGFILNKFQYVACTCNTDCNVTGGHGFNHQKQKKPSSFEGGFQYQVAGSGRDLKPSPGISPIMGSATFCPGDQGPRGRASEGKGQGLLQQVG